MIALARKTLRHEWRRFIPAIFAVGFSGLLLAMQAALVQGIFSSAAIYVTASSADLWAVYPGTQSVSFGRALAEDVDIHLRMDEDVTAVEPYLWVDGDWRGQNAVANGGLSVYLSGISSDAQAMMFSRVLPPWQRLRLRETGAVIVDRADLATLGVGPDGRAWINSHPVQVVAAIEGLRGLGGVNVLASLATAREIAGPDVAHGSTYFVAKLAANASADKVRQRLQANSASFGPVEVWTAEAFARQSQQYWMFDTGAGAGVLFMAIIVCLVGSVVTSQSLKTVVVGSAREYATLNALGVSRAALSRVVIEQTCWVGGLGLLVAAGASALLLAVASAYRVPVAMSATAILACAALVVILALLSGLGAVRSLLQADPATLLR